MEEVSHRTKQEETKEEVKPQGDPKQREDTLQHCAEVCKVINFVRSPLFSQILSNFSCSIFTMLMLNKYYTNSHWLHFSDVLRIRPNFYN